MSKDGEKGEEGKNKEEEFENIISGLRRANIKLYHISLLVSFPKGPWKYYNGIAMSLHQIFAVYLLVTLPIAIYLQLDDIFAVFEVAHALILLIGIFVNLNDFHYISKKQALWYKMLNLCRNEFYNYNCESVEKEVHRLRSLSNTIMKWFFKLAIPAVYANIFLILVVIPLLRWYLNEEQKTSDASFNIFLPLPFWSPFNSRTIIGFTFAYSVIIIEFCIIFTVFLVYIATIFYFYIELIIQLRILCFALSKSEERLEERLDKACRARLSGASSSAVTSSMNEFKDKCMNECLKEPILHHLKIMEFFSTFQEFSSFFFGLVLSVNMMVIVSIAVILTRIDSLLTVEGIKFCSILIVELLHLFLYTYCGSMVTEESRNVKKYIYSIDWYSFNSNQKKILNIFQSQSQKEFMLKASGLYEIKLGTFLQVMQTAYSVFNVFSKVKT